MSQEHSVQRLRILSTWERDVSSGAKSSAQAEIKERTRTGRKWKNAKQR